MDKKKKRQQRLDRIGIACGILLVVLACGILCHGQWKRLRCRAKSQ